MGGLGIANIVEDSDANYTTGKSITAPLAALIVIQQLQGSPNKDAVNETKTLTESRNLHILITWPQKLTVH